MDDRKFITIKYSVMGSKEHEIARLPWHVFDEDFRPMIRAYLNLRYHEETEVTVSHNGSYDRHGWNFEGLVKDY